MVKILHVITDMTVGGAGILVSRLLARQTEDSLAVLPEGSLLCSLFEKECVPYRTFPAGREASFSLRDVRLLGGLFRELKPRLVVSHASLSARLAAKELSLKAISVRHCDTRVRPLTVPLYNALTDATVATSFPLAAHLRRAGIRRVYTVENGYSDMGVPNPRERREARRALALPDDRILLGCVGRLAPVKGQETALYALRLLGERKNAFTLCLLGCGEDEGRLRALAHDLGIADSVRFLGYSPDVRRFYHAVDAHISTSLGSETSSLSLAEGMSAGCPTFASDTAGNRARVLDGGILFPVGDAASLARLFLSLLDEKERIRLSRIARRRAELLPTWEAMREEYRRVFTAFC